MFRWLVKRTELHNMIYTCLSHKTVIHVKLVLKRLSLQIVYEVDSIKRWSGELHS
jgi:hypothetical protein